MGRQGSHGLFAVVESNTGSRAAWLLRCRRRPNRLGSSLAILHNHRHATVVAFDLHMDVNDLHRNVAVSPLDALQRSQRILEFEADLLVRVREQ